MRFINAILGALALFLVACAGADFEDEGGEEQGTLAQPLTSQIASGSGLGRLITGVLLDESVSPNRLTFNYFTTSTGALTYYLPPFKTLSIKVQQGACSAVQWNRMNPRVTDAINELNDALSANGWSITRDDVNGKHTVQCLDLPTQSGEGPEWIRNFVRVTCSEDFANTVDDQGFNGIGARYDVCTVAVDSANVLGFGTSTSNENRVYRHAILNGLLKLVGVGDTAGGATNFASSAFVQQTVNVGLMTSGQLCRTKFYTIGSPTVFGTSTSKGCANN